MGGRSLRREATRGFAETVSDRLCKIEHILSELHANLRRTPDSDQAAHQPQCMGIGSESKALNDVAMEYWKSRGLRACKSEDGTLTVTPVTTLLLDTVLHQPQGRDQCLRDVEKSGNWHEPAQHIQRLREVDMSGNSHGNIAFNIDAPVFVPACGSGNSASELNAMDGTRGSSLSTRAKAKLEPSSINHSATISACNKGQEWQLASGLLNTMAKAKVGLHTISHKAAINACDE